MAYYAALASAMELLDDILHLNQYPDSLLANSPTIKSLHKNFSLLLDSLQDYPSKSDEAADHVETQIRKAAYQVLDIIEFELPKHEMNPDFDKLLRLVGQEVDSILEEMNAIKERQMHEHPRMEYGAAAASKQVRAAGITMVGFEEHLQEIKEQLCGSSSQLQVIPIVGMGGIGKTTLARNTFEDALIVSKFDFRCWITISQDYDVIKILQDIVQSFGIVIPNEVSGEAETSKESEEEGDTLKESLGEKRERIKKEIEKKLEEKEEDLEFQRTKNEGRLKKHIHKHLTGRKFLVVIDDVWNTDVCDFIRQIFPDQPTESRILLTTRLANVAQYAATADFLHQMKFLNDKASWTLLQERAFAEGSCPDELVNIGKYIVVKCQGLPLAIVVIGGILSSNKTIRHWENVAAHVGSVLSSEDEQLSKILSLSYNHLPHRLKTCFLHMASVPEDYEISISKLIKLWIAEGFLRPNNTSKSLEEYLEDLVKRSLVIITKKGANGQFKSCIIHDLLRDFCRQRGLHESFFQISDREGHFDTSGAEKVRRIIIHSVSHNMPWAYEDGKYVRSVCWFSKRSVSNIHSLEWGSVKLLRILDVADLETPSAPFAVSSMFKLKYLAFQLVSTQKKHIPESISMFQNLQTLIIYAPKCRAISLPSEIWNMTSLRHVIIDKMILPPFLFHLRKPVNLQTLETVEDFIFTNKAIRMIPNIRKLKLRYQGKQSYGLWKLHCLNNLVNLLQLEKLNITFSASVYPMLIHLGVALAFRKILKHCVL